MDFARKQLEKYGWTEGKGLGKDEDGISEPLKAKKKHSLTGVGYDPASDFTEHWWSTLYDKAAGNLEVKTKNGQTKTIKRKSKGEFEITNSTWKLKSKKKKDDTSDEVYPEFFVKTVVMGSGGVETMRVKVCNSESEDESVQNVQKITDEELFAACQGRTAHKGARHGLKALGKLARIEEQEKMLLQQVRYKGYSQYKENKNEESIPIIKDVNAHSNNESSEGIKKKKKIKHSITIDMDCQDKDEMPIIDVVDRNLCTDANNKVKNKNSLHEQINNIPIIKDMSIQCNNEVNTVQKKKNKKKQSHNSDTGYIANKETPTMDSGEKGNLVIFNENNRHHNSKNNHDDKNIQIIKGIVVQSGNEKDTPIKKKRKKKTHNNTYIESITDNLFMQPEIEVIKAESRKIAKSKKKKQKLHNKVENSVSIIL